MFIPLPLGALLHDSLLLSMLQTLGNYRWLGSGPVALQGSTGDWRQLLHRWPWSSWNATSGHQGWPLQSNTRRQGTPCISVCLFVRSSPHVTNQLFSCFIRSSILVFKLTFSQVFSSVAFYFSSTDCFHRIMTIWCFEVISIISLSSRSGADYSGPAGFSVH